MFAGVAGSIIGLYRIWMERLSGIFAIIFRLMMLDMVHIPFLSRERRVTVGGVLLVVLGIMLLSGSVGYFISLSFRLLQCINYDTLLNYL